MKELFRRLVRQADWANARVLEALRALDAPPEDVLRLLSHVLVTESIYHERMRGEDPWPQDFWPSLDLDDCASLLARNRDLYGRLLDEYSAEDLGRPVRYRNSAGVTYHTAPSDMLLHLALHGGHHRGQIAHRLRVDGHEPLNTDFITFTREEP